MLSCPRPAARKLRLPGLRRRELVSRRVLQLVSDRRAVPVPAAAGAAPAARHGEPLPRALRGLDAPRPRGGPAVCPAHPRRAEHRRSDWAAPTGSRRSARPARPTSSPACRASCSGGSRTPTPAIELADSVSQLAVDQMGAMRVEGPHNAAGREGHGEGRRVDRRRLPHARRRCSTRSTRRPSWGCGSQDQIEPVPAEHARAAARRRTSASATPKPRCMNATIHQWRYGQAYGDDLFRNTAADLDGWRQR